MADATTVNSSDKVVVRQWNGGGTALVEADATVEQVSAAVVRELAVSPTYLAEVSTAPFVPVTITVDTAITAALHRGRLLIVTATDVTLTGSYADLGAGFNCIVVNASGGSVVMGGMFNAAGSTRIANGGCGGIIAFARTGETRVQWFADWTE